MQKSHPVGGKKRKEFPCVDRQTIGNVEITIGKRKRFTKKRKKAEGKKGTLEDSVETNHGGVLVNFLSFWNEKGKTEGRKGKNLDGRGLGKGEN